MAVMPLSYASFNGRPIGVCAVAQANREDLLVQLMSAWEKSFNTERQLPTWVGGDLNSAPKSEL
jgi:amidase